MSTTKTKIYTILSVAASIIALAVYPKIFAIIGAIFAIIIRSNMNERRGNILPILAIACGVIGSILGVALI